MRVRKKKMKVEIVRGHHSKEERWRLASKRAEVETNEEQVCSPYRVKRRKWTVNSSPHGHKKARDAMGREEWKRKAVYRKEVSKERRNGARTGVVVKRRRSS